MKRVTIQITNSCNLSCRYCYQRNKGNSVISDETLKSIADHINTFETSYPNYNWPNESLNPNIQEDLLLDFFGGEVLLYPKKILYFLHYFDNINKTRKYSIEISSNCTLLQNPDVKTLFSEYHNKIHLLPSLDGNKTLHNINRVYKDTDKGSFDEAKAGLDFIYKNYPDTLDIVRITVAPNGVEHVYSSYKYLKSQYPNLEIQIVPTELFTDDSEFIWNEKNSEIYVDQIDKILSEMNNDEKDRYFKNNTLYLSKYNNEAHCLDGGIICFDVNGDIYPCFRFTGISSMKIKNLYKFGNVNTGITETGFEKMKELRDHIHCDDIIYDEKCKFCSGKRLCSTCPAAGLEYYGDTNHFSTLRCPVQIKMIKEIRKFRRG